MTLLELIVFGSTWRVQYWLDVLSKWVLFVVFVEGDPWTGAVWSSMQQTKLGGEGLLWPEIRGGQTKGTPTSKSIYSLV